MNIAAIFDGWNRKKQKLHLLERELNFHEREVWFCDLGINIGHEQNGGKNYLRPILVLKKFNKRLFWGLPLTKAKKSRAFHFPVRPIRKQNSHIILSQIRTIDANRLENKMGMVTKREFSDIKKAIGKWLE